MSTHPNKNSSRASSRTTAGARTRTRSGSLPPGSRNRNVYDNLARGLTSGGSRPGSRNKDPEDQDVPPDRSEQVTDGGTAGSSSAGTHAGRDDKDVQRVCAESTYPLRRELEDVREKIDLFPMGTHEELEKISPTYVVNKKNFKMRKPHNCDRSSTR